VDVRVFDLLGRCLWHTRTSEARLRLPDLSDGTYLIQVQPSHAKPILLRWVVAGN